MLAVMDMWKPFRNVTKDKADEQKLKGHLNALVRHLDPIATGLNMACRDAEEQGAAPCSAPPASAGGTVTAPARSSSRIDSALGRSGVVWSMSGKNAPDRRARSPIALVRNIVTDEPQATRMRGVGLCIVG